MPAMAATEKDDDEHMDKLAKAAFMLAVLGMVFAGGLGVGKYEVPPHDTINAGIDGLRSWKKKIEFELGKRLASTKHEKYPNLWFEIPKGETRGVLTNDVDANEDLIFFSDCQSAAQLMTRDGQTVHTWRLPYSEAYPDPDHLIDPAPDAQVYWRKARPRPDGSLVAVYEGINQTPYGGGIIKIDRQSNVEWATPISAHHDFTITDDGSIFVLYHKYEGGRIDDYIAKIDGDTGKILESISIATAVRESLFDGVVPERVTGDWLHTNSIAIVDAQWARRCRFGRAGDILLSHRTLNAMTLIDRDSGLVTWHYQGTAQEIHDADMLADCRIAFFGNRYKADDGQWASRIRAYDLSRNRPRTVYANPDEFYSYNRGSQVRLDNGGWLITESTQGTILQVDGDGEVVWKYVDENESAESVCVVNWAMPYPRSRYARWGDA
jgi:hypothetical protein